MARSSETPEQCLKRELKEEFTIESEIGEFVAESIFDTHSSFSLQGNTRIGRVSADRP